MDRNVKRRFKAPEGRYQVHSEKPASVAFQPRRGVRLAVATLHGGAEEGLYMVFNVGDYLHISPFNATDEEPRRSIIFNPTTVRDGYPCCHAHMAQARDGVDLVVGIANGEVLLMSLRAQLQAPTGSTKALVAATLNADNAHDGSRCNAVAWVPRSEGQQFLAAHASGTILVFKKSPGMLGESSSKLLPSLSSKGSGLAPHHSISVAGGGINDVAFSPDGGRLAVACRDGALRVLEWPSGHCVAGFQGYYGALLCCCWSPDAKYIATGGEDDLVALYSVADGGVVAWGEGHSSWVARIAFDPVVGRAHEGLLPPREQLYRLGSAGQDATLCLWDVVLEEEPACHQGQRPGGGAAGGGGGGGGGGGIKRVGSSSLMNIPTVGSSASVSAMAADGSAHRQGPSTSGTGSAAAAAGSHQISSSMASLLNGGSRQQQGSGGGGLAPSVPRADMTLIPPIMQHRVHVEPLSDVVFTEEALFTACYAGQIKCWLRPSRQQAQEDSDNGG